jgi:hypothetical protein
MGEAAKAVGAGLEVEFRGKKYLMADFNVRMIGLLSARLERRSIEAVERMRTCLPAEKFEEWMKAAIAIIAAGHFGYGSKALADFSFTPEGMQYGCFLQLYECDREVTEELAADIWEECKEKIAPLSAALSATDPTKAPPEGEGQAKP